MNNEEKILAILENLSERFDHLEATQEEMKTDVAGLKNDVAGLKDDLAELKDDVSELQETVRRVAIIQENVVLPRLDSLAAAQKNLRRILAPTTRVDEIEDEVSVMKSVIKTHSERLAALEKAQ